MRSALAHIIVSGAEGLVRTLVEVRGTYMHAHAYGQIAMRASDRLQFSFEVMRICKREGGGGTLASSD